MVGVLSCPPNSFGRHTSLLVTRAGSILRAYARMGLHVLRPSLSRALVVVEEETLPPPPPLLVLTSLSALGPTSEELEAAERVRQMYLFLDVLPPQRSGSVSMSLRGSGLGIPIRGRGSCSHSTCVLSLQGLCRVLAARFVACTIGST